MRINCTPEKIKMMLSITERLMKKANIEIRDTWDGYEGENYDNLITNKGRTDGQKIFDVRLVRDGVPRLVTEPYTLEGHKKSLGYEVVKLLIPIRRANDVDAAIHEIVHFLQHTTEKTNADYFNMKQQDVEGYKEYVDQRVEQEAHFVQLLYIEEFDEEKIYEEYKAELKALLKTGLADTRVRTDLIVFAKSIGVI